MKKLLLIGFILCGLFSTTAFAQEEEDIIMIHSIETMPMFPGGHQGMIQFISENLKYPADAEEKGIQGRVVVRFVVERDGSITNVEALNTIHETLAEEAIRVVKSMPNWKPGTQRGKPVRVMFNLPINFKL